MSSDSPLRGRHVLACLGATVLAGCLALRTPPEGEPVSLGAGEVLVLGRVRVLERDIELTPWDREPAEILSEDPVLRLSLFQVESGRKRPYVPVESGGRFAWILPAGTYLLYHTPSVDPPLNEPLAAFQVAAGPDPIDLGELVLDLSVGRSLSASVATYTFLRAGTRAGGVETERWFLARHPGSSAPRPGAFVVDPELGGLFEHWSREACARVLARHGLELGPG